MKAVYRSGEIYLVRINDKLFYYGNGETINAFGINAAQFLRFNPYMEDVSDAEVEIPQKIIDHINKHKG
mgnify:CR=1 FL=1